MKLVQDFDFGIGECKAGCVCSTDKARAKKRGPFWDPIWNCNCGCAHGTKNYNANHSKADRA